MVARGSKSGTLYTTAGCMIEESAVGNGTIYEARFDKASGS